MSTATFQTLKERAAVHFWITKPRIVELLLATAVPTLFLASGGMPRLMPTIAVLVGGTAAAASANTFNSVYDRDIDAQMHRTGSRPDHLDTRNHTTISISMAHHLLSIQQVEWGDPRVVFIQYSCRHRAPDPTAFFFLFLSLRHVLATLTYMCALLKEVLAQR